MPDSQSQDAERGVNPASRVIVMKFGGTSVGNINRILEVAKKVAQSLIDGEKKAIFLGNVATQSPQAGQLHALALELANLTGACVGFVGEAANSVGGYVAGALPTKLNARTMLEQPRQGYVLMGAEPEFDFANAQLVLGALKQAKLVVFMSAFKHAPALEYADVMLPIAPFTETAGTFINTEGRVQSFNGVVRPQGDARPAWKLLRDMDCDVAQGYLFARPVDARTATSLLAEDAAGSRLLRS